MKNYFEFVKELSVKNNKTFKEVLLDPQTKKLWNEVRPKKQTKPKVTKQKVQKTPGVKIDLSRATIVPAEVKTQPDQLLDYYTQRWLNFTNSINVENLRNNEEFRKVYTLEKRPRELKPYNLESIKYLLYDKTGVIEDSPLSYELSSFILSPRVFFPGKRNIRIYRNDITKLSRQLKDLNMQGQTSEFVHDFESLKNDPIKPLSLYEQISDLEIKFRNTRKPTVIYLNDMLYTKRQLYSLIFLYGGFLKKVQGRDKYLIVTSTSDLGKNVASFYKNLDVGYFNSGEFDFGLPSATPEFNFSKIANYLAGTSSEIPVASMSGKTFTYTPIPTPPTSPIIPPFTSPIVAMAIQPGAKDILANPFPYFNKGSIFPTQLKEFSQRIYFIRDKTILLDNPNLKPEDLPNEGDFIYLNEGYLSQVINKKGKVFKVAHFYTDNYGVNKIKDFTLRVARNVPSFQTIRFIERGKAGSKTEYTSLRNMAINPSLTYKTVYDNYKQFFTDQVDDSNIRGNVGSQLDFNSTPNTFIRPNKPSLTADDFKIAMQTAKEEREALKEQAKEQEPSGEEETVLLGEGESELEGGSNLTEDDLISWISTFNLKGCDVISDVGNGQKAYLLSF